MRCDKSATNGSGFKFTVARIVATQKLLMYTLKMKNMIVYGNIKLSKSCNDSGVERIEIYSKAKAPGHQHSKVGYFNHFKNTQLHTQRIYYICITLLNKCIQFSSANNIVLLGWMSMSMSMACFVFSTYSSMCNDIRPNGFYIVLSSKITCKRCKTSYRFTTQVLWNGKQVDLSRN